MGILANLSLSIFIVIIEHDDYVRYVAYCSNCVHLGFVCCSTLEHVDVRILAAAVDERYCIVPI